MSTLMMESFNLQPLSCPTEHRRYYPVPHSPADQARDDSIPTFHRVRSDASVPFSGSQQLRALLPSHSLRVTGSCEPEVELSLTHEEVRRLLDAADYVERERALLLRSLQDLSNGEKVSPYPVPSAPLSTEGPMLLRDEGGLFRLVPRCSLPSPSHTHHQSFKACPPCEEHDDDIDSDHFRMFRFKVKLCRETKCHDWAECPYAHPGEKASRRDPRLFRYSATPCPDVKRSGKCNRGDACSMAHGVFECWLHPSRYRTQPCKDGLKCPRKVCFFAHSHEELRLAPAAAAAAAADAAAAVSSFPVESPPSPSSLRKEMPYIQAASSPKLMPSPSSILSPLSSSPPASPPARPASLTPFALQETPPMQFASAHHCCEFLGPCQMYPAPVPRVPCHPVATQASQMLQSQEMIPAVYARTIPMAGLQPLRLSDPGQYKAACAPQWQQPPACNVGRPNARSTCVAQRGEEEPDLSWVVNLVQ